MIEQLKEMLEMQKKLDASILEQRDIKEYPYENMRIALFVELGELLNELPTKFKHWKVSAVDNRDKALIEYVDCLHFALSIHNYYHVKIDTDQFVSMHHYNRAFKETNEYYTIYELLEKIASSKVITLHYVLALGYKLGFTWEEIYNAYKEKNKVNYERLESGY